MSSTSANKTPVADRELPRPGGGAQQCACLRKNTGHHSRALSFYSNVAPYDFADAPQQYAEGGGVAGYLPALPQITRSAFSHCAIGFASLI